MKNVETPHTSSSIWPVALAGALTIATAGLVIHPLVSVLAALVCLAIIVAWTFQRFQVPLPVDPTPHEPLIKLEADGNAGGIDAHLLASNRSGRGGLIWFIATEAVFFGNLISAYLFLRGMSEVWPPPGTPQQELLFPGINTVILLLSGLPAHFARKALDRGNYRGLQLGLVVTALLGAAFLSGQVLEYSKLGFAPQTNVFAAAFFVLTGFHSIHVVVGIGLLLAVLVMSISGRVSAQRNLGVEVATTYWHFVDVVWIFLFGLLYLLR